MPRFDAWPEGDGWLLEVQADLLRDLNTRIVVPLMPPTQAPRPARQLNPVLSVAGAPQVMVTQFLSAVPLTLLKGTPVSLRDQSDEIGNALDLLFTGV